MRYLLIILLVLATPALAEEDEAPVLHTQEAPVEEPEFDLAKADTMVVRVESPDGKNGGTGFYVGDSLVVTASHVTVKYAVMVSPFGTQQIRVADYKHMLVFNKAGARTVGEVVWRDEKVDVAVIRIDSSLGLVTAEFEKERTERNVVIHSIGHPAEFRWAFAHGHVLHSGQELENGSVRGLVDMFASFGVSGAPVFLENGKVVGVIVSIIQGGGTLFVPTDRFLVEVEKLRPKK